MTATMMMTRTTVTSDADFDYATSIFHSSCFCNVKLNTSIVNLIATTRYDDNDDDDNSFNFELCEVNM